VIPETGVWLEAILRHQGRAVFGDDVDGVDDLPERFFVNEVVEIHTHPAGFGPLAATIDLALECERSMSIPSNR